MLVESITASSMTVAGHLVSGIEQIGIHLTAGQLAQIEDYLALIQQWNKAYNLVGTSDTQTLIQKHLLDSLAISPHITQGPVLDVGSGAGLPGIPLAIALPDISFTLLDSNGKKARFMRHAALQLKLNNIAIVQSRIQHYEIQAQPKTVLARAFAPVDKALALLSRICAPQGRIQIMLGTRPDSLAECEGIQHMQVLPIKVPGLASQRHLLIAQRDVN